MLATDTSQMKHAAHIVALEASVAGAQQALAAMKVESEATQQRSQAREHMLGAQYTNVHEQLARYSQEVRILFQILSQAVMLWQSASMHEQQQALAAQLQECRAAKNAASTELQNALQQLQAQEQSLKAQFTTIEEQRKRMAELSDELRQVRQQQDVDRAKAAGAKWIATQAERQAYVDKLKRQFTQTDQRRTDEPAPAPAPAPAPGPAPAPTPQSTPSAMVETRSCCRCEAEVDALRKERSSTTRTLIELEQQLAVEAGTRQTLQRQLQQMHASTSRTDYLERETADVQAKLQSLLWRHNEPLPSDGSVAALASVVDGLVSRLARAADVRSVSEHARSHGRQTRSPGRRQGYAGSGSTCDVDTQTDTGTTSPQISTSTSAPALPAVADAPLHALIARLAALVTRRVGSETTDGRGIPLSPSNVPSASPSVWDSIGVVARFVTAAVADRHAVARMEEAKEAESATRAALLHEQARLQLRVRQQALEIKRLERDGIQRHRELQAALFCCEVASVGWAGAAASGSSLRRQKGQLLVMWHTSYTRCLQLQRLEEWSKQIAVLLGCTPETPHIRSLRGCRSRARRRWGVLRCVVHACGELRRGAQSRCDGPLTPPAGATPPTPYQWTHETLGQAIESCVADVATRPSSVKTPSHVLSTLLRAIRKCPECAWSVAAPASKIPDVWSAVRSTSVWQPRAQAGTMGDTGEAEKQLPIDLPVTLSRLEKLCQQTRDAEAELQSVHRRCQCLATRLGQAQGIISRAEGVISVLEAKVQRLSPQADTAINTGVV